MDNLYSSWADLMAHAHVTNQDAINAAEQQILDSHPFLNPNGLSLADLQAQGVGNGATGNGDGGSSGFNWSNWGDVPGAQYAIDGYNGLWTPVLGDHQAFNQYAGQTADGDGAYNNRLEQNGDGVSAFQRTDFNSGWGAELGNAMPYITAAALAYIGGAGLAAESGSGAGAAAAGEGTADGAAASGTAAGGSAAGGDVADYYAMDAAGSGAGSGAAAVAPDAAAYGTGGDVSGFAQMDAAGLPASSSPDWLKLAQAASKAYGAMNSGAGPVGSGQVSAGASPYASSSHGGSAAPAFSSTMQQQQPAQQQQLAQMLQMPTFGMPQSADPSQNNEMNNSQNLLRLAAALRG
jgi:hypothetical protein